MKSLKYQALETKMPSFDKLKKNYKNIIATDNEELAELNSANGTKVVADTNQSDSKISKKIGVIERSIKLLNKTNPISFDDKALYDLAESGRDDILNQALDIQNKIRQDDLSSEVLSLINTAFELGQKTKSYNLISMYQKYFKAGQKLEEAGLKSTSVRRIRKESYFDIVKLMFNNIVNIETYSSYNKTLLIKAIDQYLQPNIQDLSNIKDTVKVFTEKGYIKPKRGALTKQERSQQKNLKNYINKTFRGNFKNDLDELYNSLIDERSKAIYEVLGTEKKVIDTCIKFMRYPRIKNRVFSIPVKAIAKV